MFLHYLKIAWRNLLKYKTQSVISILGLAIGFTAFSFTMSWIRYERGYDRHIKDADRIYKILRVDDKREGGVRFNVPDPLKMYLEDLPEVESVTAIERLRRGMISKDIWDVYMIVADTSFFKVFYPNIKINYPKEISSNPEYIILSDRNAKVERLNRENIMQRVEYKGSEYTLLDIVQGLPDKQTNIPFDVMHIHLKEPDRDCPWCYYSRTMYVRIRENVNVETLSAKIDSIDVEGSMQGVMSYILVPLRKAHYTYPEDAARIKFNHLRIFAIVSVLVILCALFNYLMLFINKIKLRSRELALRKVNGASNRKLILLLLIEIGMIVFSSLLIGAVLTELFYSSFVKLSEIEATKQFFLKEMVLYGVVVFIISLLGALLPIYYFMRKNIAEIIQPEVKLYARGFKNSFTKASLFIQLIVGTLLMFCTFVFLYQYRELNSTDIGFDRFRINTFSSYYSFTKDEILKIPGVEKVILFNRQFLPRAGRAAFIYETESGEKIETEHIQIHQPDFIDFFGMEILEGRNFHDGELNACLINETAKRKYGLTDPIGKIVNNLTVIGVVADMYVDAPSLPVLPASYHLHKYMDHADAYRIDRQTGHIEPERRAVSSAATFGSLAYKYLPGHRESTEQAIKKLAGDNGGRDLQFTNMEEVYAKYTQSEQYLLILLSIMTGVAILIALFGIYSMITLSCSRRRKEIAIRKVNGAKVGEMFFLFFQEYFWVTLLSCVVAFPAAVYIMQRWLEQYTRRVSMEWWLFAGIFVLIILIVFTSIFFRVNFAARENPSEVVKAD